MNFYLFGLWLNLRLIFLFAEIIFQVEVSFTIFIPIPLNCNFFSLYRLIFLLKLLDFLLYESCFQPWCFIIFFPFKCYVHMRYNFLTLGKSKLFIEGNRSMITFHLIVRSLIYGALPLQLIIDPYLHQLCFLTALYFWFIIVPYFDSSYFFCNL